MYVTIAFVYFSLGAMILLGIWQCMLKVTTSAVVCFKCIMEHFMLSVQPCKAVNANDLADETSLTDLQSDLGASLRFCLNRWRSLRWASMPERSWLLCQSKCQCCFWLLIPCRGGWLLYASNCEACLRGYCESHGDGRKITRMLELVAPFVS